MLAETDDFYLALSDWYQSDLGQLVFLAEQFELNKLLPEYFGYYLVQMGLGRQAHWLESSPIKGHIEYGLHRTGWGKLPFVKGCPHELPFAPNSLDVVLLPHTLEFSPDPSVLLEEVAQALIPEGYLIILGFNPVSLWGMWKLFKDNARYVPWSGHFRRIGQIRRWLEKTHCDIDEIKTFFFRPPLSDPAQRKKWRILETLGRSCWPWMSGLYIVVARKQIERVTPIKLRNQKVLLTQKSVQQVGGVWRERD